jgi:hypothetical protein
MPVSVCVPTFFTVTVCAALVVSTRTSPKSSVLRLSETEGATPVPDRLTVFVPTPVSMLVLPVFGPRLVGWNVIEIVQCAPGARDAPQFSV